MSRIDELIEQLCPDGVELVPLKKLCGNVSNVNWGQEGNHEYRYIDLSSVDPATHAIITTSIIDSSSAPSRARQIIMKDDVLFATTRPTQMRVTLVPSGFNGQICSTGYCVLRVNSKSLIPSYLLHVLGTSHFHRYLENNQTIGNYPSISDKLIKQYSVPVPPMAVQEEIVRILDSFSELEAELEAELEQRNRQYRHYRDKLIDQTTSAPWRTLGEISQINRGASPRPIKKYIAKDNEGVPWIKIGDVDPKGKYVTSTNERITNEGATKSKFLQPGSFILSNSMSFGRPYILKLGGCIHDGWLSIENYENQFLPDYLYHLLRSSMIQAYWRKKANNGSVSNLNAELVKSTPVPVPSLDEQHRIVSILDKFDALVNNLSSGIPAEIEARRKQYEYYRDKLLTFKEKPGD